MNNLQTHISSYLEYCLAQKRLDEKTIKAYRIDLIQFYNEISISDPCKIAPYDLEKYIEKMHRKYKPKSVRRKNSLTEITHRFQKLLSITFHFDIKLILQHIVFFLST